MVKKRGQTFMTFIALAFSATCLKAQCPRLVKLKYSNNKSYKGPSLNAIKYSNNKSLKGLTPMLY